MGEDTTIMVKRDLKTRLEPYKQTYGSYGKAISFLVNQFEGVDDEKK